MPIFIWILLEQNKNIIFRVTSIPGSGTSHFPYLATFCQIYQENGLRETSSWHAINISVTTGYSSRGWRDIWNAGGRAKQEERPRPRPLHRRQEVRARGLHFGSRQGRSCRYRREAGAGRSGLVPYCFFSAPQNLAKRRIADKHSTEWLHISIKNWLAAE